MAAQQPDHGGQLWRVVEASDAKGAGFLEALFRNLAARGEYNELAQKLGVPMSAENFENVMANLQAKQDVGILVRERRATSSVLREEPLAYNAVVKEIELVGSQLCFELVEGTGPPTGWVHIAPEGHELLVRTNGRKGGDWSGRAARPRDLGQDQALVNATDPNMSQALAVPQRKCHLVDDTPPWYEQITSYEHFAQHEELSGVLHKYYTPLKAQIEEDRKEVQWDHISRDESGFVHGDGDPLHVLGEDELNRTDGEEFVVVYKTVAVRRSPSTEGKVIGTKLLGDHLQLFEPDLTNEWRSLHFTLRGGWGSPVKAWVMMSHPALGALVRPYRAEAQTPAKVEVLPRPAAARPGPGAEEGELHEVVQKRIAIRDNPSPKGNMLGCSLQGETVRLYEWDSEKIFRKIKFQRPDGLGEVDAWVMVEHPKLGTLLRPVAGGEDAGDNRCQRCGKIEEGMGDIGLCDACFSLG